MIRLSVVFLAAAIAGCTGSGNSAGTGQSVAAATCDEAVFEKSYRQIREDHQKSWDRFLNSYFSGRKVHCAARKEQISKMERYINYRQANLQCLSDGRKEILADNIKQNNEKISEYQEKCG